MNTSKASVSLFNRQTGITVIKLAVVIIILGIFATFAIPKLVDTSKKTAIAAVNASQDGFKTAYALAKTVAADANQLPSVTEVISVFNFNSDWNCTAATGICTSPDWDGDTKDDLTISMYTNSDCRIANSVAAGTDLVKGYDFELNESGTLTCQTTP